MKKFNKHAVGESGLFTRPRFPHGKKGMEMWQIVLLILVMIFLLAVIIWYGFLGGELKNLLNKFADIL